MEAPVKPNLEDLAVLIKAAKALESAQKAFEKRSLAAREVDMSMSAKAIGKAGAEMHWAGMHVETCWDNLHAAAVDLGLCDPKPPECYAERVHKWGHMHGAAYQPKKPRCIEQI